jgi:hypothetical protein
MGNLDAVLGLTEGALAIGVLFCDGLEEITFVGRSRQLQGQSKLAGGR